MRFLKSFFVTLAVVTNLAVSSPISSRALSGNVSAIESTTAVSSQFSSTTILSGITSAFESTTAVSSQVSSTTASSDNATAHQNQLSGSGYATFYNDNVCTVSGGEAVSISNPGCLKESGRHSIYIQEGARAEVVTYSLVLTSGTGCSCQVQCINDLVHHPTVKNFCFSLEGYAYAESFRWIEGNCGKNNCA